MALMPIFIEKYTNLFLQNNNLKKNHSEHTYLNILYSFLNNILCFDKLTYYIKDIKIAMKGYFDGSDFSWFYQKTSHKNGKILVLLLDGNSETSAQVWSNLCHKSDFFFAEKKNFPSCVRSIV